jgi:hypothetical protein
LKRTGARSDKGVIDAGFRTCGTIDFDLAGIVEDEWATRRIPDQGLVGGPRIANLPYPVADVIVIANEAGWGVLSEFEASVD